MSRQIINPRRKRKLVLRGKGIQYWKNEVIETGRTILAMAKDELQALVASPSCTVLEMMIAKDVMRGGIYLERWMNRCYGKPEEYVNIAQATPVQPKDAASDSDASAIYEDFIKGGA